MEKISGETIISGAPSLELIYEQIDLLDDDEILSFRETTSRDSRIYFFLEKSDFGWWIGISKNLGYSLEDFSRYEKINGVVIGSNYINYTIGDNIRRVYINDYNTLTEEYLILLDDRIKEIFGSRHLDYPDLFSKFEELPQIERIITPIYYERVREVLDVATNLKFINVQIDHPSDKKYAKDFLKEYEGRYSFFLEGQNYDL